jgi:two-component system, OmpR family, alkaline phosphatase synthesis response regulator PhoP
MSAPGNKTILVVEDDPNILNLVRLYLEKEGYVVVGAATGLEALSKVKEEHPHLVILDLMLPELDGLEVCKRIRANPETSLVPIIMLTAKAEEADTVIGLELGADDYITKPFSPKALAARVKAVFRRTERPQQESDRLQYGRIVMDLRRHEVKADDIEIPLTAKEYGLLEYLFRHTGHVLTRDDLLNAVWGYDYHGTTRTVDVHVRRLKQKIPILDEAIVAVKSVGYKLREL